MCACLGCKKNPSGSGQALPLYYTSSVDGSQQPFGLYVPGGYDGAVPCPVVFHAHGYGGSATASFGTFRPGFADEHGWLLVNLHGRRITFYDGPGEADMRDVLAYLEANYNVDRSRLFFEGSSMGATGAFRLGARTGLFTGVAGADGWTDFRLWHRHWYAPASPDEWEVHPSRYHPLLSASPLFYPEMFERTSLFLITDLGDATVWPENGVKLHDRLLDLGITHQYKETPGGHGSGYSESEIYEYFASLPLRDWTKARLKCRFLQHGRDGWLEIRRFREWGLWATANGDLSFLPPGAPEGPPRIAITLDVDNASRLALYLRGAGLVSGSLIFATVNGVSASLGVVGNDPYSPDLVLDLTWTSGIVSGVSEGSLEEYPPVGALVKRPEQEGPLSQAFCGNIILVYGTSHANPSVNLANQDEANLFLTMWQADMDGDIVVKTDAEVTAGDLAVNNLVLFGTEDSNSVIYDILNAPGRPFNPPFSVEEGDVAVGSSTFTGAEYGVFLCYPNPLAPDRMVVISHQTIDNWFHTFEALPWYYPDYVVFDTTAPLRASVNTPIYPADAFVLAGWFDENWDLGPSYLVEFPDATGGVVTHTAGSDPEAVLKVLVTDAETGTAVTGLSAAEFRAYIDGDERVVTAFSELGGGEYQFSVGIDTLEVAGYYIEVVAEDATATGSGYLRLVMQ